MAEFEPLDRSFERMDTEEIRLVVEHLRRLPVWNRMVLMGMEPTYDTYENKPTWVEADV